MVRMAQRVEQHLLVVFAAALPALAARRELSAEGRRVEALARQARVGQLVDDAGVAHQVLHRPARQAQQAHQPVLHLGPLGQQREVALAAQQRLDPVDEAQRRGLVPTALGDGAAGALHQQAQAQPAVVAQLLHARREAPVAQPLAKGRRQAVEQLFTVNRQWAGAAGAAASLARAALAGAAGAGLEQRVELRGDELAHAAQVIEQRAGGLVGQRRGRGRATGAQALGDPGQVVVVGRQQVRLLVVEELDAVLDAPQEGVAGGQPLGGVGRHQPLRGQPLQAAQRAACAQLGELAAAHDEHQLHDELDLADAAARELHVVGALGPAGGAAVGLVADLLVQLPQALEHAVVEVAAVDEGRDQAAQRQCSAARHGRARRHDAALQPGEALPLAPLHLEVLLQHRQAHDRRAAHAVGAQRQIDTEHEAVVGGVADQREQPLGDEAEVLVEAHRALAVGAAGGVAVVLVHVDEVDVGGHVELARTELAHADDPQLHRPAVGGERRAMAGVGFVARGGQGEFERGLGQVGHAAGNGLERRGLFQVEHRQPFEHQLPRHAQRARQITPALAQPLHEGRDGRHVRGRAGRQQAQLGGITSPDALHVAAVRGQRLHRRGAGQHRNFPRPNRAGRLCSGPVSAGPVPAAAECSSLQTSHQRDSGD